MGEGQGNGRKSDVASDREYVPTTLFDDIAAAGHWQDQGVLTGQEERADSPRPDLQSDLWSDLFDDIHAAALLLPMEGPDQVHGDPVEAAADSCEVPRVSEHRPVNRDEEGGSTAKARATVPLRRSRRVTRAKPEAGFCLGGFLHPDLDRHRQERSAARRTSGALPVRIHGGRNPRAPPRKRPAHSTPAIQGKTPCRRAAMSRDLRAFRHFPVDLLNGGHASQSKKTLLVNILWADLHVTQLDKNSVKSGKAGGFFCSATRSADVIVSVRRRFLGIFTLALKALAARIEDHRIRRTMPDARSLRGPRVIGDVAGTGHRRADVDTAEGCVLK
jgi:hypothetical protein